MQTSHSAKQIASHLFCLVEGNPKTPRKHYSYFLIHPEGNILFHPLKRTSVLKRHEGLFAEHGGIRLQLLTHGAEASASCEWIHQRFGAGLYFHSSDAPPVARKTPCPVAYAFSSGHRVVDGLDAIPLAGHTLGFTAYKLSTSNATFLFIGDFLTPTNDEWTARVRKPLMQVGIANLKSLKKVSFSAALPNMSKGAATPPFNLSATERSCAIDSAIARLTKTPKALGRTARGRSPISVNLKSKL
jgi:glyoxylase-like metal-dependent hydrolase (beta-lactamase superfamily II)